ncbi:MAG: hypothetical protein R2797_05895 [Gelidibacter sp.]
MEKILPGFIVANVQWHYADSKIAKAKIPEKSQGGDFFQQAKRTLAALASAGLYLCFMFEFLFSIDYRIKRICIL